MVRAFLVLLLFSLCGVTFPAIASEPVPAVSLQDRWLYFDQEYDAFVPYRYDGTIATTNLSVWLEAGRDRMRLQLPVAAKTCIYLDNQLFYVYNRADTASIDLAHLLHPKSRPRLFLTIFNETGQLYPRQAVLVNSRKPILASSTQPKPRLQPVKKQPWVMNSLAQVYLLLLAGLYVVIRTVAPRTFGNLFSAEDYLAGELDDYVQAERRVFSNFSLAVMLANALSISFVIYMLVAGRTQVETLTQQWLISSSRLGRLAMIANFILIGLAYFVAKYFLLSFTGFLFQLRRISSAHFFEFIRSSTLLALTLLVALMLGPVGGWFTHSQSLRLLQATVIGFFLFRIVKIILLLRQVHGYRGLYLFSYLCATELVPLIFVSRLTLQTLT